MYEKSVWEQESKEALRHDHIRQKLRDIGKSQKKKKTINCQGKDECEATSSVELSKVFAGVSSHCGTNILQQ